MDSVSESFIVYEKAHPQLILDPNWSLPTWVSVTVVGTEVWPWNATTKLSVNNWVWALHPHCLF